MNEPVITWRNSQVSHRAFLSLLLALTAGCGAKATMRAGTVASPMLLNATKLNAWRDAGEFVAEVKHSRDVAGGSSGPYAYSPSSTSESRSDTLEIEASRWIPRSSGRAIVNLAFDIREWNIFLLTGLFTGAEITAKGRVVEPTPGKQK